MYTLKIQNASGELYELTHNPDQYLIEKITGLTTVRNTVNLSTAGTTAGGKFSSNHLESRNIVIYLVLCGDIEANRQLLYRIFPPDSEVTVFFKSANRDVKIGARVELVDPDPFSMRERAQISLICPDPYFRDGSEITTKTDDGECVLANHGDTPVGFTAEITVETDETPDLRIYMSQTETAGTLRAKNLYWKIPEETASHFYDIGDKTVNLYLRGELIPVSYYTMQYLTVQDWECVLPGEHLLWFASERSLFSGGPSAEIEILSAEGGAVTDLRRETKSVAASAALSNEIRVEPPAGFDIGTWKISVYWDDTLKTEGADYTISYQNGLIVLHKTSGYWVETAIVLEYYYSVSGTNVNSMTIDRYTESVSSLEPYTDMVIPAMIQTYDSSKDLLRVYMGRDQISNYVLLPVGVGSTATIGLFITDGGSITGTLTYEVIHSISGADIREYTDEQISAGLMLVTGLRLRNDTTGEYMAFPDTSFQNGDKIAVSTVPGDLRVTVVESEWMQEGTSLVREVLKTGSFFKIAPGENTLKLTAVSNAEHVSADFAVQQLYGGV